jgi:integration host factor subunit beta|tara:strand:- start:3060 stop:3356 length:297 start_codon:yes stop_codon:yes gene_type:complete
MVRSEIISILSKKIHRKLKKSDLEKILQIFIDTIVDGIKNDKATEIRSFGRFASKKLRAKLGRDPRTGETIQILEKKSIAFKMSKDLKKSLNEGSMIN